MATYFQIYAYGNYHLIQHYITHVDELVSLINQYSRGCNHVEEMDTDW
jgi:hypothetical protein